MTSATSGSRAAQPPGRTGSSRPLPPRGAAAGAPGRPVWGPSPGGSTPQPQAAPVTRPHGPATPSSPAGYGPATVVRAQRHRGLLALPAVLLALVVALLGGAVDQVLSRGFGLVFAGAFAAGGVLAALVVRRDRLLPVLVTPPLLYAALALGAGLARGLRTPRLQALELFTALVVGAPTLVGTTALVLLVGLMRRVRRR